MKKIIIFLMSMFFITLSFKFINCAAASTINGSTSYTTSEVHNFSYEDAKKFVIEDEIRDEKATYGVLYPIVHVLTPAGFWAIIILLIIILISILYVLFCKAKANERKIKMPDNENTKCLGTAWLSFYTYFRLPAGIFVLFGNILLLGFSDDINTNSGSVISFIIDAILLLYSIFTLCAMISKSKTGYYLNMGMIIIESIMFSLKIAFDYTEFLNTFLLSFIIFSLIWSTPNFIYFYKRREMYGIEVYRRSPDSNDSDSVSVNNQKYSLELKVKIALMISGIFALLCVGIYFISHTA